MLKKLKKKATFVQKWRVQNQISSKSVGAKSVFLKIFECSCTYCTHTNEVHVWVSMYWQIVLEFFFNILNKDYNFELDFWLVSSGVLLFRAGRFENMYFFKIWKIYCNKIVSIHFKFQSLRKKFSLLKTFWFWNEISFKEDFQINFVRLMFKRGLNSKNIFLNSDFCGLYLRAGPFLESPLIARAW